MAPNENEIAKIREAICPPWEIAAHCVSKTKITFFKVEIIKILGVLG